LDQGDRSVRPWCDDQRRWDVAAHQREHLDPGGPAPRPCGRSRRRHGQRHRRHDDDLRVQVTGDRAPPSTPGAARCAAAMEPRRRRSVLIVFRLIDLLRRSPARPGFLDVVRSEGFVGVRSQGRAG
jgi:hypothetical protein